VPSFRPELDPVSVQIVQQMSRSPNLCKNTETGLRLASRTQADYLNNLASQGKDQEKLNYVKEQKAKKEFKECTFKPKMQTSRRKASPLYVAPGSHYRNLNKIADKDTKNKVFIQELSRPRQRGHEKTNEELDYEHSKEELTFEPKLVAKHKKEKSRAEANLSPDLLKSKSSYSKHAQLKKSMEHKKKKVMKTTKSTEKMLKKKQNNKPKKSEETPAVEDMTKTIIQELNQSQASFSPSK